MTERARVTLQVSPQSTSAAPVEPIASSSTVVLSRSYELGIFTDGTTPDGGLYDLEWELVRVAAKASKEKLGLPDLVMFVSITPGTPTKQDFEASRNRHTWTGSVVLTVQFQVNRADIVPAT
jgi:hypothetical protein